MQEVDARTLECPAPVILTKNNFRKLQPGEEIRILVDNETASNNVKRALERLDTDNINVEKQSDELFIITAIKADNKEVKSAEKADESERKPEFYLITRAEFGEVTDGLGAKLMDSFLGVVFGEEQLPAGIFLLNQGVKLACEGSPQVEILKKIEAKGVPVMACGLCLKDQGLTEKLQVGKISAMPDLVSYFKTHRVVTIG